MDIAYSKDFEELNKAKHERNTFDCGIAGLNTFLAKHALQNFKAGVSITKVLPYSEPESNGKHSVCAFYCTSVTTMQAESLPQAIASKLPRYPIPLFLVAQLAVDKKTQGQGVGEAALMNALEHLTRVNENMRAVAVVVDCIDVNAKDFYQRYGFEHLCEVNGRERLFISMNDVLAAVGSR